MGPGIPPVTPQRNCPEKLTPRWRHLKRTFNRWTARHFLIFLKFTPVKTGHLRLHAPLIKRTGHLLEHRGSAKGMQLFKRTHPGVGLQGLARPADSAGPPPAEPPRCPPEQRAPGPPARCVREAAPAPWMENPAAGAVSPLPATPASARTRVPAVRTGSGSPGAEDLPGVPEPRVPCRSPHSSPAPHPPRLSSARSRPRTASPRAPGRGRRLGSGSPPPGPAAAGSRFRPVGTSPSRSQPGPRALTISQPCSKLPGVLPEGPAGESGAHRTPGAARGRCAGAPGPAQSHVHATASAPAPAPDWTVLGDLPLPGPLIGQFFETRL